MFDKTRQDITSIEEYLSEHGYRKTVSTKFNIGKNSEEFDYYKAFYDFKGNIQYQIFFLFWNLPPQTKEDKDWAISGVIQLCGEPFETGRFDLMLSHYDFISNPDVKKVEDFAEDFYGNSLTYFKENS